MLKASNTLKAVLAFSAIISLVLLLFGCGDELNFTPVASAGGDQEVATGSTVSLDGSGSYDEDEDDSISYEWNMESLPLGSSAALTNTNTSTTSFTADVSGEYQVSLVVSDDLKDSDPDYVTITATYAPVAVISATSTTTVGASHQLDGTGSYDVDGDELTYEWTVDDETNSDITSSTSSVAYFEPAAAGDFTVTLTVSDGVFESEDSISITVTE